MARSREHPDPDLLADLAAEVLPEDLARRVEAHVLGCARCADDLAEAEGIRVLLRRQEVPTLPEDVADRIGAAIAGLQLGPAAGDRAGLEDDPDADARWAAAAARGAVGGARGRRQVPADEAGLGSGFTVRRKVERGREASVTRLRRVTGTPARLRRQAIEEQRSAQRAGRLGKLVLGTAAAFAAVAVGGLALRALDASSTGSEAASSAARGDSGDSGGSSSDLSAQSGGPAPRAPEAAKDGGAEALADQAGGAVVLVSGGNYTDAALATQARQLVVAAAAQQRRAAAFAATGGTGVPAPKPQPTPAGPAQAGNETLRNPAALRACLSALDALDEPVLAVDLARYNGRDSAVIVLRATGGDYDVWIVARDCRPGADGTLKYLSMTP
jgi:hypothetical protein